MAEKGFRYPYGNSSTMDWLMEARDDFRCTESRIAELVEYERAVLFASRAVKTLAGCRATSLHTCFVPAGTLSFGSLDLFVGVPQPNSERVECMQGQHGSYRQ
jgi:spore coat protein U-like protein